MSHTAEAPGSHGKKCSQMQTAPPRDLRRPSPPRWRPSSSPSTLSSSVYLSLGEGVERGGTERFHSWAHSGHGGRTSSRLDAPAGTSGATLSGHGVAPEESTPRAGAWSPEMPHSQWQVRGARLFHCQSQLMPPHQAWRRRGHDPSSSPVGYGDVTSFSPYALKGTGDFIPPTLLWLYGPRKCH